MSLVIEEQKQQEIIEIPKELIAESKKKSTNWILTYNNPPSTPQEILEQIFMDLQPKFLAGQLEKGKEGTPHLQYIIQFKNAVSFNTVKQANQQAHIEQCRSIYASYKYVTKDDTRQEGPWEFGTNTLKSNGGDRKSATAVSKNLVQSKYYAKFGRPVCQLDFPYAKHPWQLDIDTLIQSPATKRTIVWICDSIGGQGKTEYIQHLQRTDNSVIVQTGGKKADIFYTVQRYHSKIFFDLTRSTIELSDHIYDIMESIKNGSFVSTKYEPIQKFLKTTPHVIVMANDYPKVKKMSIDRWLIYDIKDYNLYQVDVQDLLKSQAEVESNQNSNSSHHSNSNNPSSIYDPISRKDIQIISYEPQQKKFIKI